jgi:hypothetical protein
MSDADLALILAAAVVALLVSLLAIISRNELVMGEDGEVTLHDDTKKLVKKGSVMLPSQMKDPGSVPVRQQRRSWLGGVLAGTDHRMSTSKTVVVAWTLAVAYGLLTLLIADWLGDPVPWNNQVRLGLQEEYLLLLGGPFAAAILAKYTGVRDSESKPEAEVGSASPQQIVTDDEGNADLGDLQYVIFTVIALAFFLGSLIANPTSGFPELPAILTGLVLTSTGGYAAKKLIAQAAPTLASVVPASAAPGQEVHLFGVNLCVPASVSATGTAMEPIVHVGGLSAEVTAQDQVLGNDRLTVKVPDGAEPGSRPISATRADGVPAGGPSGMNVLPFTVIKAPEPSVEEAMAGVRPDGNGQS